MPSQSACISAWNAGLAPDGSALVWGSEPGSGCGLGAGLTAAEVVEVGFAVVEVRVAVVEELGGGGEAVVVAGRLDPPQLDKDKQTVTPTIVRLRAMRKEFLCFTIDIKGPRGRSVRDVAGGRGLLPGLHPRGTRVVHYRQVGHRTLNRARRSPSG